MKCKDCGACKIGFFKSKPDKYVCTGVKEPFVIEDTNGDCTEYKQDVPTWRDIMDCKVVFGIIYNMFSTARDYGYKYFVWNDRIYKVLNENKYIDTGFIVDDIK